MDYFPFRIFFTTPMVVSGDVFIETEFSRRKDADTIFSTSGA
jgi:hypothetical protein